MAWSLVCSPKSSGGLGLRSIRSINKAALMKLTWELVSSNSQWSNLMRAKVMVHNKFTSTHVSSSVWQGLKHYTDVVLTSCNGI